jgi:hypothetical protein
MAIGTFDGFMAFVLSQDDTRKIDNRHWNTCAVGDYAREVLGHEIPFPILGYYSEIWYDSIVSMLYRRWGSYNIETAVLFSTHHFDEPTLADELCDGIFDTYGELKRSFAHSDE